MGHAGGFRAPSPCALSRYYYNTSTETLYFKPNATDGTTPVGLELVVPVLETILHIDGTANAPVQNVNIRGVGFRDSTPTYLKKWGVPSGMSLIPGVSEVSPTHNFRVGRPRGRLGTLSWWRCHCPRLRTTGDFRVHVSTTRCECRPPYWVQP